MPWQVPITVDGLEYPVTFNTEEQPTQQDLDEAVQQILSQRGQALQPAQPAGETPGYLSQLGSALGLGYRQMKSGVGATFNALTGDTEDVAAEMAEQAKLQREQQAAQTPQDIEFMRRLDEAEKAYELARGPVETISALSQYPAAAFAEPGAAFKTAVQSAPNVLISGATSLAGYGLGGLVGGAAGIETGPGAILTGIAGAAAGGALSNTLMEAGPSIFDALNEKTNGAAANMTAEQISAFLKANPDVIEQGLKTGAIRGSVIGAVEALGVKGSGRLLTMPERAAARAAQKTLVDAGVDVTSKKAVDAALLDPTIRSATKTAAEAAKSQFSSAGNLARMAGASAIETGAAGAGELAAQAAAGQDISTKEAFMEMLGEAALSAPMAAATKAVEGAKYALTPSQEAEQPEATQAEPTVVSTAEEPPSMLPFTREDIRATQLPFGREDIRATELPFSRQNIRGLSMIQPEIVIAEENLKATENVPFTDITGQAATNIVQENARIASQLAVQPQQAAKKVGAEVTPSPDQLATVEEPWRIKGREWVKKQQANLGKWASDLDRSMNQNVDSVISSGQSFFGDFVDKDGNIDDGKLSAYREIFRSKGKDLVLEKPIGNLDKWKKSGVKNFPVVDFAQPQTPSPAMEMPSPPQGVDMASAPVSPIITEAPLSKSKRGKKIQPITDLAAQAAAKLRGEAPQDISAGLQAAIPQQPVETQENAIQGARGIPVVMGSPGYRITDKKKTEEYQKQGGWKLHLAVLPENYKAVDEWLAKNHKGTYKLLTGGDVGESDFTIYVGDKDLADDLAQTIESEIGSLLLNREAGTDQFFTNKVTGRFDVQRTGKTKDVPWVFYGAQGIPLDQEAAETVAGIKNREDWLKAAQPELSRIDRELSQKYGTRYTGTKTKQQPVETQEDAAPEIPLEESVREEPQDRAESREAEETGAGDQLLSPAEGEGEVISSPKRQAVESVFNAIQSHLANGGDFQIPGNPPLRITKKNANQFSVSSDGDLMFKRGKKGGVIPITDVAVIGSQVGSPFDVLSLFEGREVEKPVTSDALAIAESDNGVSFERLSSLIGDRQKAADEIETLTGKDVFSAWPIVVDAVADSVSVSNGQFVDTDAKAEKLRSLYREAQEMPASKERADAIEQITLASNINQSNRDSIKRKKITPPGEPTTATEGMVTPGGVATERDLSKPEQMTLDEATERVWPRNKNTQNAPRSGEANLNGMPAIKKAGGWMFTHPTLGRMPVLSPSEVNRLDHQLIIQKALTQRKPVAVEPVDWYDITLPEGYVRQGDLYVFQPQTTAAETQTPVPLRGGTGAAGVASSSLGGGRSPELPKVSPETETTSSEKLDPKLIEAERKQAKEEEAAVKQQEKLDQDTKSSLNSVVGPQKKDPVVGTVTKADVETAREALTNSGEIPNAYLTNVYESREAFLADRSNARLFPASYARLQNEKNIEGLYENGQTLIFAKQIQVSDLDRGLAKMLGVSDEQAAARRVIAHENGHRAISLFTMAEKRELRGYLMRAYSEEQIAKLVERYTEYADWRTNPESRFEALEELLMRDFERMEKIPTGGVWDDIVQFLKRVWSRLTGQKGEPKLKELKDVVRLMRNAMKRPAVPLGSYTLKDGGQVKLSMIAPTAGITPEMDAEYLAAVEAGDMVTAQRMVDEAARKIIASNPRNVVKLGRFLSKSEYESAREQIEELPREVFYVGNVEVIRNPTGDDIRGMTNEERAARGGRRSVDPDTRFTKDNYGNTWRWKATGGMHSMIEPSISRREGVDVNQNNDIPYHSDLVKDAIRSGAYIPSKTLAEYPNYADFVKPSSADPVTRDDQGNVIPLSQRFQTGSPDIRFSRPQFSSDTSAAFSAGSEAARSTLYSERDMDIREAIRRAYEAMPKTNSVAVPIGELFAKTEELMPGVTQDEFSNVLQDLFEDNGAVLQEGDSDFFVTTPEGRRAGFVVVMPSKSISVPLALRSMAMSGPSGQPINQQKYDEALAAISDFLTGKQTVQFPGKLTLSSSSGVGLRAGDSGLTQGVGEAARTAGGGTGAGIARGQPSDAQAQGAAQQGFGPYSVRNLVGEASRIGVADVRIDPESQHGAYTVVSESGEIYIVINPARMANRIAANDGDVQYAIGSILNEELIHAADMAVLREQWLNSNSKLTLTEFVKEQDVKTVREMIQVAKSSNDPLEATRILFDAITSSINLYAGNDVTSLDSVEAFLNAASHDEISSVMGEFVRQMIQTGMYQTVSEKALFRKFIEKVKALARKIADVFAPAKEGQYGKLIQERLNGIEELLTYASSNTGAKASKIPIEEIQEASKPFKEDLVEASKGRDQKAAFQGNVMRGNVVPDHNVNATELYKKAANALLDSLLKNHDIIDVAESIQDPDLQAELGMQIGGVVQPEDILNVRQYLGALLQRRLTVAISSEKKPKRLRQLELARESINAYSDGASGGGTALNNAKQVQNDPELKGDFFFSQATRKKAQKAKDKLDAITGGTEKITDIITGAEQKAAEETTQAEVEAQESAAEDDEYAKLVSEGEAELTNEEKGLWERAKMLLRRFAMYAKRKGARAANAAKASLSAEQRKELDELNAIMQMSDEEAAKAESKDRAEFAAILKKLLGEEKPNDTPQQKKTRQKRVKMIDVVRRYVESGKPIDLSDQQTALKGMLREMNKARPADSVPLERAMPWRKILSSKPKDVAEYRQRILEAVSSIESFQNLTEEQKERLADLYAEAWEERRQAILDRMLRDEIKKARDRDEISDDVEKKLQQSRNKILEIVNLGGFNNDDLVKILGERYGISTSFTEEQKARIQKLADQLQDEDMNTAKRNKLAMEFAIELAGAMDVPVTEIIANWWTSSVLFGPQTIFSIGAAFLNGGYSITTIGTRRMLAKLFKGDVQGSLEESILMLKGIARYLGAFKQAGRRAWNYLWSGDVGLLGIGSNDILSEISNFEQLQRFQRHKLLAEQLAKDPRMVRRYVGIYLRFVSRLLTALDAFNVMVTKAGTASLALRMSGMSTENIIKAEKMLNLKAYKDQVIRDYFDNKAPRTPYEKGLVDSYAEAEMYRAIDKMGGKMENADYLASESAMTMHPTGFGGVIYDAITGFFAQRQANADEYLEKMKKDWVTRKDLTSVTFIALAYLRQFAAYNAAGLTGSKFVRYASNKFNQGLSFIPFAGLLRQLEAKDDRIKGKDAFIETIYRNQVIGALMLFIGGAVLGAIEDEPDDEKRGTFWNGGWANLTPDQKKQLLAKGQKEYTMGFKYNGRWYVFNYQNWPLNQMLSAIGSMSDQIRFSPKQWNEKNLLSKTVAGMVSGVKSTLEIPALSGLQELVGNRLASKDPTEQSLDRISRVASGWVGGFVPRILKDIDFATQPELRKYETLWEKTASHIPIYRRYVGEEYYDILGKPIKRNVIPGSREFMMGPTEPEYKILGALNSRNIWLTPANAEYRMVGKGRNRRRLTQEEADAYSLETGKGYRQMLLRYGQRALQMPTERARAFLSDKADEVRDRALKKVYRGYTK